LLFRPFTEHVRSDACAVDVSFILDVHQLSEHLRRKNALQSINTDARSPVNLHGLTSLRLLIPLLHFDDVLTASIEHFKYFLMIK
jgi:hypothetical protein